MLDQKASFNKKEKLIERDIDLEKYLTTRQIVIITGVRRCGKSSLLFLLKESLKLNDSGYCYFNFDDERVIPDISVLDQIYNLHIEIYGKEPVLFFDEVQNIEGWEKFINRVYESGIKVFVTGSNGLLLSSEISTSITGRNKTIQLFTFSFHEFLRLKGSQYNPDLLTSTEKSLLIRDFNSYFSTSGFPLVIMEGDLEFINSYFQDILYRDIIARYRLSQVNEIKQIGLYFASNVGKLFSYSTLQSIAGVKSLSSIKDYLFYYEQSFLFFYLKKFDYSVKKQIMNPKKVYAIDQGFIHRLGFSFSENKGRILENILLLQLLRSGKDIYYHSGKYECDFLIKEGIKVAEAIQVTYLLDHSNYEREVSGLQEAMATYSIPNGTLITYTGEEDFASLPDGIRIIPAWKWLMYSGTI